MKDILKWLIVVVVCVAIGAVAYAKFIRPRIAHDEKITHTREQNTKAQSIKQEVFLPGAVNAVWEMHANSIQQAKSRGMNCNTQIYGVTQDKSVYIGILDLIENPSNQPLTGTIYRSGTSFGDVYYFDDAGRPLEVSLRGAANSTSPRLIYITLQEPIPPGASRRFFWFAPLNHQLQPDSQNRYKARMMNHFGNKVLETFSLILPSGWILESSTLPPTKTETVGDITIAYWQNEVPQNTNHQVEAVLKNNTLK